MYTLLLISVAILAAINFSRIFVSMTVANLTKARKIKQRRAQGTTTSLGISVVVPAYNEEKKVSPSASSRFSPMITRIKKSS